MSKINLTYDGKEYTLEYNRQSVRTMEGQGFILEDVTKMPMTMIPLLFAGAFIKNHKGLKRQLIDDIFDAIGNKTELMQALIELYAETLSTLTDDQEDQGNVSWAVVK